MNHYRPIYGTRATPEPHTYHDRKPCRRCGIDYNPTKGHPNYCRDCKPQEET